MEYTYSIIERIRLAVSRGTPALAAPVLCHLGDAWKAREATDASEGTWGDVSAGGCDGGDDGTRVPGGRGRPARLPPPFERGAPVGGAWR